MLGNLYSRGHINENLFWRKVNKEGSDLFPDCWLWTASVNVCGYGNFHINRRGVMAHRVSYLLDNPGEDIEGFYICHICDNPTCVKPKHLFKGTQYDNMKDMVSKGRHSNGDRKGEKHPQSKLNNEIVLAIRNEYKAGKISQKKLACKYGINQSMVSYIIRRKNWSHVY